MEQVIIGLILLLVGICACFLGLRFWFILLPVFGAIIGFFIGARAIQDIFGTGFLSTATSWIVGILLGLGFAVLSWFVWYAGAIILAAAVGASLASGLLHLIFDNPWGWVLFIVALIGAIIFAIGALVLNLPIYIVIVNSALGGASLIITGILTILGNITITELANGSGVSIVDEVRFQGASWIWLIAWLVLAILGVVYQLQSVDEARLPEEKWVPARAT
jgi:Domain of unknown function (DUF4203)